MSSEWSEQVASGETSRLQSLKKMENKIFLITTQMNWKRLKKRLKPELKDELLVITLG